MARLTTIVASLMLLGAVGIGVAVASDGTGGAAKQAYRSAATPNPQELTQSKVAFSAYLTGDAEVNDQGQDGVGDPDAKGSATLLAADEDTLCYGVTIRGAQTPTELHIHRAPAGQNGDVVIDLSKNVPKDANGKPKGNPGASSGCKNLSGPELEAFGRIRANPQNYYINVHTTGFQKGAARGQLSRLLYNNG